MPVCICVPLSVCVCVCVCVCVFSSDTLEWHLRAETRRPSSMMEDCMPCQSQYVHMYVEYIARYTWYTYIHTYVQCTFASTSESACEPLSRIFLVFPLHLHRQRGEKQQIEEICMYIYTLVCPSSPSSRKGCAL